MRLTALLLSLATAVVVVGALPDTASAGFRNRDGCGLYTPDARVPGEPRTLRYDHRSWCYKNRGYYPYYGSNYWVSRKEMRYRYRYRYRGPLYTYYPAWSYGPVSKGR